MTQTVLLIIIATLIFLVGVGFLVFHKQTPDRNDNHQKLPLLKTPVNYHVTLNDIPVKLTESGFPLKYSATGELVPFTGDSISRMTIISNPPNKTIYLRHPPDQIRKGSEVISNVLIPSGEHMTLSSTRVPYEFKYDIPFKI